MAQEILVDIGNENSSLRKAQAKAYARLNLSEDARLQDVVAAMDYREGARTFLRATTPTEATEADELYELSITRAIRDELARCLDAPKEKAEEARQEFARSLDLIETLPLSQESLEKLDKAFFDVTLDVFADKTAKPLEKAMSTMLSLKFGVAQRGKEKDAMILERRVIAEQATAVSHVNRASQAEAQRQLDALKDFFDFAGIEYYAESIDPTAVASVRKVIDITRDQLDKGQRVLDNSAHNIGKAASVAAIASMAVVGTSTLAAAESVPSASQSEVTNGAEVAVVPEDISAKASRAAVVATVEASPAQVTNVTPIEALKVEMAPVTASVEVVDTSEAQDIASVSVSEAPATPAIASAAVEEIEPSSVEVSPSSELIPGGAEQAAAAVPVVPSVESEPLETPEDTTEESAPITAPNSDVNVAEDETPQEAIARIITSRDIDAASFAMRTIYGGVDVSTQEPVNPALTDTITEDVAILRSQISEAAHADNAYTDKAFYALAYLDAVTQYPTLLDNPEVAAFIASITDQGEAYRNKLFATYLTEAHTALADEKAGAYNGIAEQYRAPIETLYAYTALAAMSDQKQAEQIEAIKVEEARIVAEEEAKRKAAEQAQQGLTEIEILASDEKQLVLAGIDRALQQGLITQKYADVARLVIEQEGPGALVAASGMIGNCMAEADGCNPVVTERGNGIGYGIFQWSFGRRTTLEATARAEGVDVSDIGFQVRYAIAESKARTQRNDSSLNEWAGLMAQTDPAAAVEFWRWNFERPKEELSHTSIRVQVGQEVYASITGQIDGIRNEASAVKAAREAEIERQRQAQLEQERLAEEARKAALAEGDIRSQLADGRAIRDALEAKYGGVSGLLEASELVSRPALYKNGEPMTIYLQADAAVGFDALSAAFKAHFGEDIRITDDYRDLDGQKTIKREKGDLAARPGTSIHGWGMAIDFASDINILGSPQFEWMKANAHKYGFVHPDWAHDGTKVGGVDEAWHWEFEGSSATFEESN